MSSKAKWEYMKAVYQRYHRSSCKEKSLILDEFCKTYKCHRKHAIRLLNAPPPSEKRPVRRQRNVTYGKRLISIVEATWKATGYLWSARLKAVLPLWLPRIRQHFKTTPQEEQKLLSIGSATIDRRLKDKKQLVRKRIYGTTKPGTLLKHHIPIKTDSWNVRRPGFTEVDLVSHSGSSASGDFAHTLNMTDIFACWVERRAILGKGQKAVSGAIYEIEEDLPFDLKGIDSDNGSEFINEHLYKYCKSREIQFTRGRPYKKNDNAHVEQKNWTHVRKVFGYARYDTQEAIDAMNDLYTHELRYFQNLFQPSVKLIKKERVGSKLKRKYDDPKTPFERLLESKQGDPEKMARLKQLQDSLDPFELSLAIDNKLERIYRLSSHRKVSGYVQDIAGGSKTTDERSRKGQEPKISTSHKNSPPSDFFKDLKDDPIQKLKEARKKELVLQTA